MEALILAILACFGQVRDGKALATPVYGRADHRKEKLL
jgi:hypothetical protein